VLAIVLAALAAYIFFVDSRMPVGSDTAAPAAFDVVVDDIDEIAVTALDGTTSRLRRNDGEWKLVEPLETMADAAVASIVAGSLASLEIQRVIVEEGADLQEYALDPPRLEVAFHAGEDKFRRLQIGGTTPAGDNLYARLADQTQVFLISSFLEGTFNRTPFDLRDKRVLVFDAATAESFSVTADNSTQRFTRQEGTWSIVEPLEVRGDHATIDTLITSVSVGRMRGVAAESPDNLVEYGLNNPVLSITAVTGSVSKTLLFGASDEDIIYAKDTSRPMVFTTAISLAEGLEHPLSELRNRNMFDFKMLTTDRLEIDRDGEVIVLERTTNESGAHVWHGVDGNSFEPELADAVLTTLTALRAGVFLSERHAALDEQSLSVTARFNDDQIETVMFAREGDDVFANRTDEPGSVRLELTTRFEAVLDALDTLN
jgi:hypothetical protein